MAMQVWFEEDIQNTLNAAQLATELRAHPGNGAPNADYERGYRDALRVVATAFGLAVELPAGDNALAALRRSRLPMQDHLSIGEGDVR